MFQSRPRHDFNFAPKSAGEPNYFGQNHDELVFSTEPMKFGRLRDEFEKSKFPLESVPISVEFWNLDTFFGWTAPTDSILNFFARANLTFEENPSNKMFSLLERGKSIKPGTSSKNPDFGLS